MESVEVGQIWIDKDPRMSGRRVKVTSIDSTHGWVRYSPAHNDSPHPALTYRSSLKRFPKAFRLETR